MVGGCNVVQNADNKISLNGLSASSGILKNLFGLDQQAECFLVGPQVDLSFGLPTDADNFCDEMF